MNRINWQKETDRIIDSLDGRKASLLLHACCAPCSSASLEYLTQHFTVTLFFYNPNIATKAEYDKRLLELRRFVSEYPFEQPIDVLAPDWEHREFLEAVKGLEHIPEGGERCERCFWLRLRHTAEMAAQKGFEYFGTTLTISPLKRPEIINSCGLTLAEEEHLLYLPTDLKKRGRYLRSIELSREYDLYRQDYCGCEFSLAERRNAEKAKRETSAKPAS